MSTKFLLCAVITVMSVQMEQLGHLQWIPRERNEEADALSDFDFTRFPAQHRVEPDLENMNCLVLDELMCDPCVKPLGVEEPLGGGTLWFLLLSLHYWECLRLVHLPSKGANVQDSGFSARASVE